MPGALAGQTGDLRVIVATSGSRIDDDGYVVAVDTLRRAVGVDDSVVFANLMLGIQTAELLDVSEACILPEGNPRKVVVRLSAVAELRFDVVCGEAVSVPSAPRQSDAASMPRAEPRETPLQAPGPSPMREFSIGEWNTEIDPPGLLILESVGSDELVVAQQLSTGDCPDGIRVVLTRRGTNLQAEWLHPDSSLWFEALFFRSD